MISGQLIFEILIAFVTLSRHFSLRQHLWFTPAVRQGLSGRLNYEITYISSRLLYLQATGSRAVHLVDIIVLHAVSLFSFVETYTVV